MCIRIHIFLELEETEVVKGLGSVAVKRVTELLATDLGSRAGTRDDMGTSVNLAGPWLQNKKIRQN